MRKSAARFLVTLTVVCLLAVSAFADITGDIQGTVLDDAGADVAQAKITLKNLSTGTIRTLVASDAGVIFFLPDGYWKLPTHNRKGWVSDIHSNSRCAKR